MTENINGLSRKTFLKVAGVGVLELALMGSILGCSAEGGSEIEENDTADTGTPVSGGQYIFAVATLITTLDPHFSGLAVEKRVFATLFDQLFNTEHDGSLTPWLATGYELSEDNKSYTIDLRDDVTFHDGTPFNAEAVKYNLERIFDPELAISGNISSSLESFSSAEVLDEFKIRIDLKTPSAPFLANLAQIGIISPTAAKAAGDQFTNQPVGSGPFIFESWGEDVVVKKNPDYNWGPDTAENKGPAYVDGVTFKTITEETTRVGSVQSGQVHAAETIPPQNYVSLESDSSVQVYKENVLGLSYTLFFNLAREKWADLEVRQAVQAGIDVKSIISSIYLGVYDQAFSPLTPGFSSYNTALDDIDRYDPAKAKQLLDSAGWVEGADGIREKDGERLTLTIEEASPNREKRNDVAAVVQNQLKEIGIEVKVNISTDMANKVFLGTEHDFDLAGNSFQRTDDTSPLKQFYRHTDSIFTGIDNPSLNEWLDQALVELDQDKRDELLKQVQQEIIDQAYVIPIYNFPYTAAATNKVQNLSFFGGAKPNYVDVYLQGA